MTVNVAVALIIFNRPETTAAVWEEIARAQPSALFVIADGPRAGRTGEPERCLATRAITEQVAWRCEVSRCYSEENLGTRVRVATGLDWVFDNVPEAIVLEDDTVPDPSFFPFCEELLERYRDEERVMSITGDNFQQAVRPTRKWRSRRGRRQRSSYYFSQYPHIWGWATWRRAWRHYDADMTAWKQADESERSRLLGRCADQAERSFWRDTWNRVARGEIDTWDYQWAFACMARRGLTIVPNVNLVSNIGFGIDATHNTQVTEVANLPRYSVRFPLEHPTELSADRTADAHVARHFFNKS